MLILNVAAMLSMYYKIWADAIFFEQSKKGRQKSWKLISIISISVLQGINLLTLFLLIRVLSHKKYPVLFPMHAFNLSGLNTFLSVILTYFVPFVLLNYLLVFYNNRYEYLIRIYGDKKGKLYRSYALVTIGIIVIPLLLKIIF